MLLSKELHFIQHFIILSSNDGYIYISILYISCDPEVWSNDAENSASHQRNKLQFKIYSNRKQFVTNCNNISQYSLFCSIFKQMNAALESRRDFFDDNWASLAELIML